MEKRSVNKHGLKMTGLKAASGETHDYGYLSPSYVEIFYHRRTGEVWTIYQYSLGMNWWTEYHNPNIIKVCNTQEHMTMQEIADAISEAVAEADYYADME